MSRLLIFFVVLLALATAAAIGAWKLLGWWAVLAIPLAVVLGFRFVLKPLVKRAFLVPFKVKGRVLQNAHAAVHAIIPTVKPAPPVDPETGEPAAQEDDGRARAYYLVETTITPLAPVEGKFTHWEPGELRLVRQEATGEMGSDDDAAEVVALELFEDGQWQVDDGMKFEGPKRLRLTVGVTPGVEALRFQYYFEGFGAVHLPRVLEGTATAVAN